MDKGFKTRTGGYWGYWSMELFFHFREQEKKAAMQMKGNCWFGCSSNPEDSYDVLSLSFINMNLWDRSLPHMLSFFCKENSVGNMIAFEF